MLVRYVLQALMATAALLMAQAAAAQDFPGRMVRLVVPYPPGGGVDGLARPLAEQLSKKWGVPVVIENKAGASTLIGGEFVVRAPADGTTLFFTTESSITSNPYLFKKLPFDPIKDLAPITQLIGLHQMLVVHPSIPVSTVDELVAYAKANPNKLSYASYGNGSQPHLLFESLKAKTGIQMMHVPYKGIAPALLATLSGEVSATLGGAATSGEHSRAGKLKALAIGRGERLKDFPNIPTLEEAGYKDIDPLSWFGLFAPAGTPAATLHKIQADVAEVMKTPAFAEPNVFKKGYTLVASTPEEFSAFIKRDLETKGKLIKTSGTQPE